MKTVCAILLALFLLPALDALGQAKEPPPKPKTLEQKLETRVNLQFDDTPAREALNFLAQFSDVSILIDPEVYQEKSQDELMITLRADDITIRNALELITLTKDLAWDIRWGCLFVSTTERIDTVPKTVHHHFPTEVDRALLRRLKETVTYSFDGAAVTDALEFIRTLKSVNIVIDDGIKARAEKLIVTQSVSNIPIRGALGALLLPNGLTWEPYDGVVFVRAHRGDEEPTWTQAAADLLENIRVSPDLESTTLDRALEVLLAKCPVPLFPDPELEEQGVRDDLAITLKASDISLMSAMNLLTKTNGLAWDLRWGSIWLSTPERLKRVAMTALPSTKHGAPEWEKKLRVRLDGRVSFGFDGVEMPEALEFLRKLWKLNLVVHPDAREYIESLKLSLRVNEMKMEYALAHLFLPRGLKFELADEVVLITQIE